MGSLASELTRVSCPLRRTLSRDLYQVGIVKSFGPCICAPFREFTELTAAPMLIDKLERGGRLILWLTLSTAVVLGIVGAKVWSEEVKSVQVELTAAKEDLRKALEPKEPQRLPASGIGAFHAYLLVHTATGVGLFTNVSPRSGFICLQGRARHPDGKQEVLSLPACAAVNPYSSFKVEASFIGRDLDAMCGDKNQQSCFMSFVDAS